MKVIKSLPFRLLMGIVLGMILGLVLPENIIVIVVTVKYILGQMINFCVPLIIIGFIAPSITKLGSNATRMLSIAILIAYLSSVLAAFMSMTAGFLLIPHMTIVTSTEGLRELPEVAFQLEIPQIMPVMSALVFSVLLGVASVWTKAETITNVLQEFQQIVLKIVERVIIPILPLFIAATFCSLAWEGSITRQLPVFLIVIVIVLLGHYIWLFVLYTIASIYSGLSGLEVVSKYGPAYLTAVGTMSSAATLAVALKCAHKSNNLRSDMVDFGIPLFANIFIQSFSLKKSKLLQKNQSACLKQSDLLFKKSRRALMWYIPQSLRLVFIVKSFLVNALFPFPAACTIITCSEPTALVSDIPGSSWSIRYFYQF